MEKPIREEYYTAPYLFHLSPEAREEIFIADFNKYKQSLKMRDENENNILDFSESDEEEVLI